MMHLVPGQQIVADVLLPIGELADPVGPVPAS